LNATRQYVGGVDVGWNSEFVKFSRALGVVGTAPGLIGSTGVYGTSDVVGSRLTVYPSVSLPLLAPGGYVTPKLGFHSTSYGLARNPAGTPDAIQRSVPIASIDGGLTFERDMSFVGQSFRQTLEPRVYYLYVPYRDQSQVPVFDTAVADFNYAQIFSENLFSGGDRIANANQVTVAATTRLLSPSSGQEALKVTLGQRFYLQDQKVVLNAATPPRTNRTSDFLAAVNGHVSRRWTMDAALQFNPHRNYVDRLGIGARYQPETAKVLNLGYRFSRGTDQLAALDQVDVSAQWPLGNGWSGVGRFNYSLYDRRLVEGLGGFEYNAGCWTSRIVLQRFASATWTFTSNVFVQLELNGLSRIGSNPLETLKRNIPGYQRGIQARPDTKAFEFFE
jgi:LPS-assembly protein